MKQLKHWSVHVMGSVLKPSTEYQVIVSIIDAQVKSHGFGVII